MQKEIKVPFDLTLAPAKLLTAGALSCLYEAGNLRYIKLGKTELVRKIYGALRDENWNTVPYEIHAEEFTADQSGFRISYTALYGKDAVVYQADFLIEGLADNSISFVMKGIALQPFKKNRIGLCVHHPIEECHGRTVQITRPDGNIYTSRFPDLISPYEPFLDISKLEWTSAGSLTVKYVLEGDVFATEDQRNWSDSSYKTYSTPLSIPFPADVNAGDIIEQRITCKISGPVNIMEVKPASEITELRIPLPHIGYCRGSENITMNNGTIEFLRNIPFDHYRFSFSMKQKDWTDVLNRVLDEAAEIRTQLELVIFFTGEFEKEVRSFIDVITERQSLVRSILLLSEGNAVSPQGLMQYAYPVFKMELPGVKIGYGTDLLFVDINRDHPKDAPFDFISFGVHPQAHAFDNRSLLENLQNQPDIIESAKAFAQGMPIFVSPITLKDRQYADERQPSSFIALWTLISLQNFSEAYSITFYDLFGKSGILQTDHDQITSQSATYDTLAAIFKFKPAWVIKRYVGKKLLMDGLLLENEKGDRLFFKAPLEYME